MSESLSSVSSSSAGSTSAPGARPRVAIVGAGVMGLSLGWRLARAGCPVDIYEAGIAGQGASHAAAGMLAACAEAEPGEEDLLALNRASQALWPRFAAELEAESGTCVDLRTEGTLTIGLTADDGARLRHLFALQTALGLPVEWLTAAAVRRLEPHLAGQLSGAILSAEDHQVDNRKVVAALLTAIARAGARLHENSPVAKVETQAGKTLGVVVNGALKRADLVILAAGAWSRGVDISPAAPLPVRPVKGQMLALRMDPAAPLVNHVIWAPNSYIVPRRNGRLILGATTEEKGFDTALTAGGQLALLTYAWRALPALEELPILEQWVGFRPGSRDDAPILGPSAEVEGLVYATGHHRNGILLLAVTAKVIAECVLEGRLEKVAEPFRASRFTPRAAAE
ncbi:glycine oxidase ThiO [Xanthobacter agilis]|uniref:Glycine oxidase n=1 Tax=Xanthobacter agilis TaxID=47492 RepID=A0ABU0LBX9_XANAG|nr:glycine oxidase ThiO [Xanthobacter agilis]MDQ0504654.1 glycine oxidase [Xanthobacter agilis]